MTHFRSTFSSLQYCEFLPSNKKKKQNIILIGLAESFHVKTSFFLSLNADLIPFTIDTSLCVSTNNFYGIIDLDIIFFFSCTIIYQNNI